MKASEIVSALQEQIAAVGDLPCEVFVDTRATGSFRMVVAVAAGGDSETLVISTVAPAYFDEPCATLPRSIGAVLSEVAKKAGVMRGSDIRRRDCWKCEGSTKSTDYLCPHCGAPRPWENPPE